MADFDVVHLRGQYERVCNDYPSISSDLKREYEAVEGLVKTCLKLKESETNDDDDAKELRVLLNKAAKVMGRRAHDIIEEATFEIATDLSPLKTRLSTGASAVHDLLSQSQVPLTDDRVAHLKAHVEEKYDLYRNWYKVDTPLRELKRDMSRLKDTYRQQLDWLDQKISYNALVNIQINELVDPLSKHMEKWPTEKDVVGDLITKVKGYDHVSQSLDLNKIRLNKLQESLESLIKEVIGLIDRLLAIKEEYDLKLFKIYTIRKEDFHLLDAFLFRKEQQITPLSPQSRKLFREVTRIVPIKKLELLLAVHPISDITIVECDTYGAQHPPIIYQYKRRGQAKE